MLSVKGIRWVEWALTQETDECILCPFAPGSPYPSVWIGGRSESIHRIVFFRSGGVLFEGEEVRHSCGRSRCANKRHLLAGTHAQNMADKIRHGTSPKGEGHTNARLTTVDVVAIRASDESNSALARSLGVHEATVRRVRSRVRWAHVE